MGIGRPRTRLRRRPPQHERQNPSCPTTRTGADVHGLLRARVQRRRIAGTDPGQGAASARPPCGVRHQPLARAERFRGRRRLRGAKAGARPAAQAPRVPSLVQPDPARLGPSARHRHPAQPRRVLHPRIRRAAGSTARPAVLGQGELGERRPARLVALDHWHLAPSHAALHRRLCRHEPGPGCRVPRRRPESAPDPPPSQRRGHRALLSRSRRSAGRVAPHARIAHGAADRPLRRGAGQAQEHSVAGRAMGRRRCLRHGRAVAGRRPAGAGRPRRHAARAARRTGTRQPAAFRPARLPCRRHALLPVREPAGAAIAQRRPAQCRA